MDAHVRLRKAVERTQMYRGRYSATRRRDALHRTFIRERLGDLDAEVDVHAGLSLGWVVIEKNLARAGEVGAFGEERARAGASARTQGQVGPATRQGEAVSREELMLQVWGTAVVGRSRSLDFFIGQIRAKLNGLPLQTVRGFGFRLDV